MNVEEEWAFELTDRQDPSLLPPSVYASSGYLELFASIEGKDLRYLVGHAPGRFPVVLPLGMTEIGNGAFEASSVYGYSGILTRDPALTPLGEGFCCGLREFLSGSGIASLFLRHAPFLGNAQLLPDSWTERNRTTYAVDLPPLDDLEAFCSLADQKLRWSVRYAQRNSLRCDFATAREWKGPELRRFHSIYRDRMLAKGTAMFYLFSEEAFQRHGERLGSDCELALVKNGSDDQILAGAFFLKDASGYVHYHLSASTEDAMRLQAMELLMASAIVRYACQGLRVLHLGGGHRIDGSDGLSRFKRKFSTRELPFQISRVVCDEAAYARERARLPLRHPAFFNISEARG